jgi:hypothetical protein
MNAKRTIVVSSAVMLLGAVGFLLFFSIFGIEPYAATQNAMKSVTAGDLADAKDHLAFALPAAGLFLRLHLIFIVLVVGKLVLDLVLLSRWKENGKGNGNG